MDVHAEFYDIEQNITFHLLFVIIFLYMYIQNWEMYQLTLEKNGNNDKEAL